MTLKHKESKFTYHRHLTAITLADCEYVLKKDVHYEASWKEDGGPGAYFTMKRPIDRFIAIAKRNNYDIFKVIREEGLSGPDGSLIACVRDARRYLLLLEAELTEQLKTQELTPTDRALHHLYDKGEITQVNFDGLKGKMTDVTLRDGKTLSPEDLDQIGKDITARRLGVKWPDDAPQVPGTPDDGGHHARMGTPRVEDGWAADAGEPPWAHVMALDPMTNIAYFNFDRYRMAQEEWNHLPRLGVELNHQEWIETLPEYRGLYEYKDLKYRMKAEFIEHWGQEL